MLPCFPISEISTDEKRFQNREELDKDLVKNIAENFDENQLDPIVVWKDGSYIKVVDGITWEYENDTDYLTTIVL